MQVGTNSPCLRRLQTRKFFCRKITVRFKLNLKTDGPDCKMIFKFGKHVERFHSTRKQCRRIYICLFCFAKYLLGSTQTLELHPVDAGCFKQIKRKTVLLLAEFPIQPLCQCRHNSLILAGVLKQGRGGVLRFEIAVLCGSIKSLGEDALGKDLRVGAARQLC